MAKPKKKVARKTRRKSNRPDAVSVDRTFEAEQAADTLMRAADIEANKPLLKRAQAVLNKKQKAVSKAMKK